MGHRPMKPKVTSRNLLAVEDGRYPIEPNLFFLVRNEGRARSFIFRFQMNGRRRDISLGGPPAVSISIAKEQAATFRALVARGIDPKEARDLKVQKEKREREVPTLAEFTPGALEEFLRLRKPKTDFNMRRNVRALENHLFSAIGNIRLNQLKPKDVADALIPMWDRRIGHCMRRTLESLLELARRDGYIETNPAMWRGCLNTWLPPPTKAAVYGHFQAPTLQELRKLIRTCMGNKNPRSRKVCAAIVLGALTATRKQEFVYAEAAEFDAATSTWTIPPARRKDCKPLPFRIPLSTQANMIVESVMTTGRLFTNSPYRPCVNTWGVSEKFKRLRGDKTFTIHGMRSTFSTWCAETGIDWVLREKCLMHATENAVGASYQRSDLLDQRREVMQAWADALISVDELALFLQRPSN